MFELTDWTYSINGHLLLTHPLARVNMLNLGFGKKITESNLYIDIQIQH